MNKSTRAVLAALNTPAKPKRRSEIGWFLPNSPALRDTIRGVGLAGQVCVAESQPNGMCKFYAVDP